MDRLGPKVDHRQTGVVERTRGCGGHDRGHCNTGHHHLERHRLFRGDWRDERGSAAAELVIVTPLLLLLIMGIIQFALWEHATHIADAVAQQGVSVARLQGSTASEGQSEAQGVLDQLGRGVLVSPKITATRNAANTTVIVTGKAESIIGLFSLPVRAVASGPTEAYTTPAQAP
jgi:Flp pilus assembly protein TadG